MVRAPRYKQALITWLGVYPLITLILWGVGPIVAPWRLPLRSLVVSALMVVGLTWFVLPPLMRVFHGWMTSSN